MTAISYLAVLEPAAGGAYSVFFPDLDGCASAGDSYEQAVANAAEALALHLEGMAEDGTPYPEPSSATLIAAAAADRGGLFAQITADAPDGSERVNVYLPKSLLSRVDRYAAQAGLNRSSFFGAAARGYLAQARKG